MADLTDQIVEAAGNPKRIVDSDGRTIEYPDLQSLAVAQKALQQSPGSAGATRQHRGLYLTKLVPPGAG